MEEPLFSVRGLRAGYGHGAEVLHGVELDLPRGGLVVVIGPNGCGKSTLLLALAGLLPPRQGSIELLGERLDGLRPRELARRLAFLPQQPTAPEGITVQDLVMRGRHPHRRPLAPPGPRDHQQVARALDETATTGLARRTVARLSGGQRQRAWIAMALAQETPVLLLDEPTSFLDIGHQVEVMHLCGSLVAAGRSVVAVLHDINLAARHADHLVVVHEGRVVAAGPPLEIITPALVEEVFGLPCRILRDEDDGSPVVLPAGRRHQPSTHIRPEETP